MRLLQHLPRGELLEAVVRLRDLLEVGGRAVVSVPSSRPDAPGGRDPRGRLYNGAAPGELQLLFERVGFSTVSREDERDSLERPDVAWVTFVFELRHRGREGYPLERLERVIRVDRKTATYKYALLRALADIATTTVREAVWRSDDTVGIPISHIADLWIEYYWCLVAEGVPQIGRGRVLGFAERLRALKDTIPGDLPGYLSMLRDDSLSVVHRREVEALRRAVVKVIKRGPVTHAGGSSSSLLFSYDGSARQVLVDGPLWRELAVMGHWIRDSLLLRWADQCRNLAQAREADGEAAYVKAVRLLTRESVPERDVQVARDIHRAQTDVRCVWTGKGLRSTELHVDHAIAYSLWHNNDLWNLLPATGRANVQKSDRLPSSLLLKRQRSVILDCWHMTRARAEVRFNRELGRLTGDEGSDLEAGFEAFLEAVESTALQRGCERWDPLA